ncbi:retrovirus-related pol polyprotein from transposon 17.6 [Plakobranchus ocellatus]|uniref:Retrovirus-related pol polyprotein from transposon 17.6 n=1 Tax=Plakobranchus ocellatus TaxID=259542 RepID=A0AAV4BJQ5_9GAST|nr:retrovirus-related pol polyprotein from transposon 17.6 [Plakobranchus ocellatus]
MLYLSNISQQQTERTFAASGSTTTTMEHSRPLKGHDYLLCIEYYSKYPEVIKLFTKTAHGIITALKPIFSEHSIPNQAIADNMPFNSQEFLKFAKEWDFHVTTTSPLCPQAKGQVERVVGIIKTAMKKFQDPNIAILQYRNTPITGLKYSPAQLLFNRRLRDNIPTLKINLKPANTSKGKATKAKSIFDRHAKPYQQDFKKGDRVRVQLKDKWIEGRILDKHQTRSYWINTDSDQAMYRRNTRFIRYVKSPPAAPAQGNRDSYNLAHSDNDKLNPNSHINKDKLTQSKHSGSPSSHDLLQSHSSASTQKADTQTCSDSPPIQHSHCKTKCGRSIRPPPKVTL